MIRFLTACFVTLSTLFFLSSCGDTPKEPEGNSSAGERNLVLNSSPSPTPTVRPTPTPTPTPTITAVPLVPSPTPPAKYCVTLECVQPDDPREPEAGGTTLCMDWDKNLNQCKSDTACQVGVNTIYRFNAAQPRDTMGIRVNTVIFPTATQPGSTLTNCQNECARWTGFQCRGYHAGERDPRNPQLFLILPGYYDGVSANCRCTQEVH